MPDSRNSIGQIDELASALWTCLQLFRAALVAFFAIFHNTNLLIILN